MSATSASGWVFAAGDIAPDRDDADACFAGTRELLGSAEVCIGQLETSFAHRGTRLPQARHAVLARPGGAAALARAGFKVISCAGNHCLDWGPEALAETIEHLKTAGVAVVGAGKDIREAREPAVLTLSDGSTVAILAYSSILPEGYWAEERRAGCAPLRAHTLYEPIEADQPGTMPRTLSFAHRADLAALCEDIRRARQRADVVCVSIHWGIHFVRAVIADYQREVAHAAVGAGADAIFGHHAHILKGIEFIDGKPVFYSLGNFAVDLRMDAEHAARPSFLEIKKLADGWEPDFESLYNFPPDSRYSMLAQLRVSAGRVTEVSMLPLLIGRDAIPRPVAAHSADFNGIIDYVQGVSRAAGLTTRFTPKGERCLLAEALP